jgi:hypothetical protein
MTFEGREVVLAICLAFAIVITVNAVLIYGLLRGGYREQIRMMRDALRVARDPWREEDEQIAELRDRVSDLQREDQADG